MHSASVPACADRSMHASLQYSLAPVQYVPCSLPIVVVVVIGVGEGNYQLAKRLDHACHLHDILNLSLRLADCPCLPVSTSSHYNYHCYRQLHRLRLNSNRGLRIEQCTCCGDCSCGNCSASCRGHHHEYDERSEATPAQAWRWGERWG